MKRLAVVAVAVALAAACSKSGGGSPTGPSTPQVTSVAVTGPDVVFLGRTGSFSATMTGGSATCTWGGDSPHIGTISASGVLSGVGNGNVTIWCDAAGLRGTKLVQVVATYAGSWVGSYRVTSCTATADFQAIAFCEDFPINRVLPISGSFTQSNLVAMGAFTLGQVTAPPASGPVRPDGSMTLNLTHEGTGIISVRSQWQVRQDQDGRITGNLTITFTAAGFIGNAIVQGEIFNTNRSSNSSASRGAVDPQSFETLDELLQGMARQVSGDVYSTF